MIKKVNEYITVVNPGKPEVPSVEPISNLIHRSCEMELSEFNLQAQNTRGAWYKALDEYYKNINDNVRVELYMQYTGAVGLSSLVEYDISQKPNYVMDEEVSSRRGVFYDMFKNEVSGNAGIVFVTDGDIGDPVNRGIFIPISAISDVMIYPLVSSVGKDSRIL